MSAAERVREALDAVLNAMHSIAIDCDGSDQGPTSLAIAEQVIPPLDAYAAAIRAETLADVRERVQAISDAGDDSHSPDYWLGLSAVLANLETPK